MKFNNYTAVDWLVLFLRVILGGLFVFSGIVKLIPIEPFELKFVEMGVANWQIAPYLARIIIAFEIILGLFLLFNILPKLSALAIILVLVFFTIYLTYDIIKNGNDSNCGCFGTFIVFTPLESIIKNVLMIPLAIAIYIFNKKAFTFKLRFIIPIIVVVSLATPFVLYPVDDVENYVNSNTEKLDYPFPAELMPDFEIKGKKVDLTKGEYLLSFMSVNCVHCKKAAYKLYILNQQNQLPPVYLVLIATEPLVPDFIKETKADFPYYIFNEGAFFQIAGNSIPRILYVKDGLVKAKFDNISLTEQALLEAIKK